MLFRSPGSRVAVPSTVGATQNEVNAALKPLGLTSLVAEKRFSEEISAGRVIQSIPEAGGRVDQGGTVKLIISKGPERFVLPQIKGLTASAARTELGKIPVSLQPDSEEFNSKIPTGYVIDSDPPSGEKVKRNALVVIRISKGIEQVALASYVGKSADQEIGRAHV